MFTYLFYVLAKRSLCMLLALQYRLSLLCFWSNHFRLVFVEGVGWCALLFFYYALTFSVWHVVRCHWLYLFVCSVLDFWCVLFLIRISLSSWVMILCNLLVFVQSLAGLDFPNSTFFQICSCSLCSPFLGLLQWSLRLTRTYFFLSPIAYVFVSLSWNESRDLLSENPSQCHSNLLIFSPSSPESVWLTAWWGVDGGGD